MFELTGNIKKVFDTQVISEKFQKREFVVTDNQSQYPQDILFQLTQDKCGLLDSYKEGDAVKVSFNLRGREWVNPKDGKVRYFNSLDAWRLEGATPAADPLEPLQNEGGSDGLVDDAEDDLPF